jgi:ubiquitin conjugation factor E4 B
MVCYFITEYYCQVIQWFIDALLLNGAADAMRPDRSKVSSEELLTNLSVVLLKLCEPFIDDEKKAALVDPGFVCSTTECHGGLYDLTGENTLPRLGENVTNSGMVYNPKNSFIPICFFFCSRSLALSVVPGGSRYENIVRNVYHIHRTIRQQNGDPRTDPRFDRILQLQYCKEIVMMSPTYIADVSRFYNVAAGILLNMDKEKLKTMPEHIVDDMCSVLVYASSFAGQLLAGSDFGNTFRLTVTLLSKDYAHVSANNSCHLFCSARNFLTLVSCRFQILSSSGTTICVPN